MRLLTAALLLFSQVSHAEPVTVRLDRSENPDRLYAGQVYMTGSDHVTLVATEGPSPEKPALWRAYDRHGKELWRQTHSCPDFSNYTTLLASGDRAVCKVGRDVIAIDMGRGNEVWRYTDSRNLYMMAGAGGRVAVSADNEELVVLDAKTGTVTLRLDTSGATFEEVAPTPSGPMALFVQDPPGKVEDSVELELGNGPERVVLAGLDPDRRLIATPIGKRSKGIEKLVPAWSVPFEGYSFEIVHSGGAIITQPSDGLRVAWDAKTGARLWQHTILEDELASFGDDGGVYAVPGPSGWLLSAIHPRRGTPLWSRSLPAGLIPTALGQGDRQLGLVSESAALGFGFSDQAEIFKIEIPSGHTIHSLHSTPKMLVWVLDREGDRSLHIRSL